MIVSMQSTTCRAAPKASADKGRRVIAARGIWIPLVVPAAIALASAVLSSGPAEAGGEQAPALPAAMMGTWGWEAQSCANASDDGRMIVKARSVAFFAAFYRLQKLAVQRNGAIRAAATTTEEGEAGASRNVIELKLVTPSLLSVRTAAAGTHAYIRCAVNPPAR
jgi:hypothetical protein